MSFVYDTIINIIDYLILFKYLNYFSEKRNLKKVYCNIIFTMCILLVSFINQFNNKEVNLILSILMIYIYSFTFAYKVSYRLILPILYIGCGIVAELIGFVILNSVDGFFSYKISYYVSAIICEMLRFLIVYIICNIKKISLPFLPFNVRKYLFIIPALSIVICYIAISILQNSQEKVINVFCIMIICMTIASNILMFKMFYKVLEVLSENHENQLLLQEAKIRESYYQEIENSNKEVHKIRHDLKNTLLAICGEKRQENEIADEIKKIVKELEDTNKNIYTQNVVFNTIISNKVKRANELNIRTDVSVSIPQSTLLDYKDAGVLLGNIMDNAIEACEKVDKADRWISIKIVKNSNMLVIEVCNSKIDKPANVDVSDKKELDKHGIGIQSIRKVVNKYAGYVEFLDKGKTFEVSASLYNIK